MGVATGEIEFDGNDIAGTVIANAVRLETAGKYGHLLIDKLSYSLLPAELQALYHDEEQVPGKRAELIAAHRCIFKEEIDEESDEAKRERITQNAKAKLQILVEELLASKVTREFILQHNQLPKTKTRAEIATTLVDAQSPMTLLWKCVRPAKPEAAELREELNQTIWRLVEVLAPICLSLSGLAALERHLESDDVFAELSTNSKLVALCRIACVKGVSDELADRVAGDRLDEQMNKVISIPHPPILGIAADGAGDREDIIEVFTEGLMQFLDPFAPKSGSVRAELQLLADEHIYVCVFLPYRLSARSLARLQSTFPELIVLVLGTEEESPENNKVLAQIHKIRNEFGPGRPESQT